MKSETLTEKFFGYSKGVSLPSAKEGRDQKHSKNQLNLGQDD
jgi:hypothetical protein